MLQLSMLVPPTPPTTSPTHLNIPVGGAEAGNQGSSEGNQQGWDIGEWCHLSPKSLTGLDSGAGSACGGLPWPEMRPALGWNWRETVSDRLGQEVGTSGQTRLGQVLSWADVEVAQTRA